MQNDPAKPGSIEFVDACPSMRFSQLYVEKGEPLVDSTRMRSRLAAVIPLQVDGIILRVRKDFGTAPQHNTVLFWEKYLASAPLEDVLDLVTIVYEVCKIEGGKSFHARLASREFLEDAAKIFSSENVGYRITRDGVVHLAVDREYERSAAAIIRGLDNRRYKNVLSHFNAVQQELDKTPPDFKQAIRAAFDAVEALFKLMFDGAPRLGGDQIQAYLVPWVQQNYSEKTQHRSAMKLVQSLKDWIEACHMYRHAQRDEEPVQPSLDFAIALISSGASYLRWLGTIDQALVSSSGADNK